MVRSCATPASWLRYGVAVLLLSVAGSASAADSGYCNAFVGLSYPSVPAPNVQGSIDRVAISVASGDISGGAQLEVSSVYFDLDCRVRGCDNNLALDCNTNADCGPGRTCLSLGTTCIDDGMVIEYVGNISTTCGVSVTASVADNRVTFDASPAIVLPAFSSGCKVNFDVRVAATQSNDSTPNRAEQVAGLASVRCTNGLFSSAAQSGYVPIDPPPTVTPTATATFTPSQTATPTPDCLPPGAPCADDGDACTADVCSPEGRCSHPAIVESPECDTCTDGLDNDDDGGIDCRDRGCSLFAELQDFGVIALRTTGNKNARIGGNVNIENTASGAVTSIAGVCSRSVDVRGGATLGALAVTSRATFGEGETGERIISIRDRFASPPTLNLRMQTDPPFVGPGVCETSPGTVCGDDFDCAEYDACVDRLTLSDPTNANVDRDGTSDLLQRCEAALAETTEAAVCLDSVACTPVSALPVTPASAARGDNLRATKSAPAIQLEVGHGLQVICVNQLKLGPDGVDTPSELRIVGHPDTVLVMRVRRLVLGSHSEVVLEGIPPSQVVWYMPGRGAGPKLLRASILPGTIFAPERSQVFLGGETQSLGAIVGSRVKVLRAAQVGHDPFCAPVCEP